MFTFDATPSGTSANSYADIQEFLDYWAGRSGSTVVLNKTPDEQKQALVQATNFFEPMLWKGIRSTQAQSLRWPRRGVVDQDGYMVDATVTHPNIKKACCEMAGQILIEDRTGDGGLINLKEIKVGPILVKFDEAARLSQIPPLVKQYIMPFLKVGGNSRTYRT